MATYSELTPGKAAQQWAKEHPNFEGILALKSLTRKGRGGWGVTSKTTSFAVSSGRAAAIRDDRKAGMFNGVCDICGKAYLERTLANSYSPDPRTGQPLSEEDLNRADPTGWHRQYYTYVYGEWMYWGHVCPGCREANNLKTDMEVGDYDSYREGNVYAPRVKRPGYKAATPNEVTLDIRDRQ